MNRYLFPVLSFQQHFNSQTEEMAEKGAIAVFMLMTTPYQSLFTPGCLLALGQHSLNFMAGLANVKAADLIANFSF